MDDATDDGMEDGTDGWKASFHPNFHGWMMGRMTGQMTGRIKGKLHDVLAIFSYCPSGFTGRMDDGTLHFIPTSAATVRPAAGEALIF